MKAKDLKLRDVVYRASVDNIRAHRVMNLSIGNDGEICILLNSNSRYDKPYCVAPDAEAITFASKYEESFYFDLQAAQVRQSRIREKKIEDAKASLEQAARFYAETLGKYKDAPLSKPEGV